MWDENRFDLREPNWNYRIIRMLAYLKGYDTGFIKSFMDCGAGGQHLKNYLPDDTVYIPVDYTGKWGGNVRICNFNDGEFCEEYVDCVFLSGILEYIDDYAAFIKNCCKYSNKVVSLSYNTTDLQGDIVTRESKGWNCHISKQCITDEFKKNGFNLIVIDDAEYDGQKIETYFLFEKDGIPSNYYDKSRVPEMGVET